MSYSVSCTEYQAWLIESLSGASNEVHKEPFISHAAGCKECRENALELKASWEAFRELPPLEPPLALRNQARTAVLGLMADERASAARRRWLGAIQAPLAVGSGLLVAGATLSLLSGLIWASALPRGHLFFCAAIFTGLLVGAFSWIYSATTSELQSPCTI